MKALGLWTSAALTIFVNGFLHGLGAGGAAALAAFKGGLSWKFALATGLGVAATNGGKRVLVWSDTNEIPNPFPGWTPPAPSPSSAPSQVKAEGS